MSALLAWIDAADRWLLFKINRDWTHPSLDALIPVVTDIHVWPWFKFLVAPAGLALWFYKERARALRVLVVAALAAVAVDAFAHRVLKPSVGRIRPTHAGIGVIERAPAGGRYSFPSNHAANVAVVNSAVAVAYPPLRWPLLAIALLIAYSRPYVGVHYPLDVLCGLLLGFAVGWPWARLMLGGPKGSGAPKRRPR